MTIFREYSPFAATVAVLLAGWMLAAYYAPSPAVLAAGVFVAGFVALGAGVLSAWALWGDTCERS